MGAMFGLRAKQLQRQLHNFIEKTQNDEVREFAKYIFVFIFGSEFYSDNPDKKSLLDSIFETLNQDESIGRIFANSVSLLATDEITEQTFYQLFALTIFGNSLINSLLISTKEPSNNDKNISQIPFIDKKKIPELKEFIKNLRKEKNESINSIEDILGYILKHAHQDIDQIRTFESWQQIIAYIYGSEVINQQKGAKELENLNVKELLLRLKYEGPLISSIFDRYDGILSFSMSLLTILSGTNYSQEYAGELNQILESVGSSSRITLIQQRLRKNVDQRAIALEEMREIKDAALKRINSRSLPIPPKAIEQFFMILTRIPFFEIQFEGLPKFEKLPGTQELFSNPQLSQIKDQFLFIYDSYRTNISELYRTLKELNDFLDSTIKRANTVTAALMAKGLQAALPIQDVERCERVGIRLKEIIATSSAAKMQIPPEFIDLKQNLLQKFQQLWEPIQSALKRKANEEKSITSLDPSQKIFQEMFNTMDQIIEEFSTKRVFNGYAEEVILASRILASLNETLTNFEVIFQPIEQVPYNSSSIVTLFPVLRQLSEIFLQFKKIGLLALMINELTKKLVILNREFVFQIGLDPVFIENPYALRDLIINFPKIIKREAQQKLITSDVEQDKLNVYAIIVESLVGLSEISIEDRQLIKKYSEITM
jgi:hypothetical protein